MSLKEDKGGFRVFQIHEMELLHYCLYFYHKQIELKQIFYLRNNFRDDFVLCTNFISKWATNQNIDLSEFLDSA